MTRVGYHAQRVKVHHFLPVSSFFSLILSDATYAEMWQNKEICEIVSPLKRFLFRELETGQLLRERKLATVEGNLPCYDDSLLS